MSNRFQKALGIQEGACNPSGIAHALLEACQECIKENVSQHDDPAVRLIVHQLAHVAGVDEINESFTLYSELTKQCKEKKV